MRAQDEPGPMEQAGRRLAGQFMDLTITRAALSERQLFEVMVDFCPPGQGARRGINENYARELLELHTLGVDGGYTQQDVINVARIFTGWSIERPRQGAAFAFHERAHDRAQKIVMGLMYPAGHGRDEGIRLLKWLANHPATMHHVSQELCQRFVSDDPPDGCVDDAVAAWQRSGGDIRAVLRAIFSGPDFWAPADVRTKVKTPLEFLVSGPRRISRA